MECPPWTLEGTRKPGDVPESSALPLDQTPACDSLRVTAGSLCNLLILRVKPGNEEAMSVTVSLSFRDFVGMVEQCNRLDAAERKFNDVLRRVSREPASRRDIVQMGNAAGTRWRSVAVLGGTSLWDAYQKFQA